MRKIKEILRLRYEVGLSYRAICKASSIGYGTIVDYLSRAKAAGLTWPIDDGLSECDIYLMLFPHQADTGQRRFAEPCFATAHQELKVKYMTKLLLWQEYHAQHGANAYSYSQYCHRYNHWLKKQKRSMRQVHTAGEKLFIDYCGPTIPVINSDTGEIRTAQVFVAVMGTSNYTFACASWTQNKQDWLNSHVKAFEFLGGVPEILVPDNLKSAVNKVHRYEPELNASYQQLAEHYGVAVIPARPYKPKDKSKAEVAVLIVERWIMARLRHHQFFSLASVNQAISELLKDLNNRPFKKLPGTRASQFNQLDKPELKPLPTMPYEYRDIKKARVNVDYHIEYDKHYYSVPEALVRREVEVQATDTLIDIYYAGNAVAKHARSYRQGQHTTIKAHMPQAHQVMSDWNEDRFLRWAGAIGIHTEETTKRLLKRKQHPQQAFRSIFALLGLAKKYGNERLNAACERALLLDSANRKSIESILKQGLDKHPMPSAANEYSKPSQSSLLDSHENVRGPDYYRH